MQYDVLKLTIPISNQTNFNSLKHLKTELAKCFFITIIIIIIKSVLFSVQI